MWPTEVRPCDTEVSKRKQGMELRANRATLEEDEVQLLDKIQDFQLNLTRYLAFYLLHLATLA